MYSRAASAYKKVAVESASPQRVLDELFSRILFDLRRALAGITNNDVVERCKALSEALQLVGALENALDTSVAPELCANLLSLYRYVREQIVASNSSGQSAPIEGAIEVITEIHDAFRSSVSGVQAA